MGRIMFGMEMVTLVFMCAILYAVIFEIKLNNFKNRLFFSCVALNMFTLLIDGLKWYLDGNPAYALVIQGLSILVFCNWVVILAIFTYYIILTIEEHKKLSWGYGFANLIISVINIMVTVFLGIAGLSFTVIDGYFVKQEYYMITIGLLTLCMLVLIFLIVKNAKYIGRHDLIVLLTYMSIPVLVALIDLFIPGLLLGNIATSFSLMLVFIFLQSKEISQSKLREKILNEVSYVDSLTYLKNRRSYDFTISTVNKEADYGVLFCDVNGLKYTNDNFGHEAGDQLLVNFKNILCSKFDHDTIYRISGDEFVVIVPSIKEEEFIQLVNEFRILVAASAGIASIGDAYGCGASLTKIISDAEMKMYDDKNEYYKCKGIERRR